jgi:hypothetical protein
MACNHDRKAAPGKQGSHFSAPGLIFLELKHPGGH